MNDDSLTYRTLKNVSYGFVSFGIPILLSIVVTPIVVRRLGVTDYGIYILTNTIIGFLGLLDLGVTGALTKYISEYHSRQEYESLNKVMHSANSLFFLIGTCGLLIFFILGKYFLPIFNISGASQAHIFTVFMLGGLVFFVNAVNSVYTTIPAALQRFDIVTKLNMAQLTAFSLSILALVLLGFQLKAIMIFNLITVVGVSIAYRFYSRKLLTGLRLKIAWSAQQIKKLYSFGLTAAFAGISISSLNQLDRLLIPVFLGPVQLSYYSLPGNVAQKTAAFMGSVSNIFFPLATSMFAIGALNRLGEIYRKIVRNLSVIVAAMTISIMVFGYKILEYWLGATFAEKGFRVLQVLAITYAILALFGVIYHFLMGIGKEKVLAGWSGALAILNLILLLILIKPFGIMGAAWAYLLGVLPIAFLFYWIEKYVFKAEKIFLFYSKLAIKLLFTALIYYVIVKYFVIIWVNGLISLIIIGPLAVLFYMVLYKLLGFFEKEDLQIFYAFGGKILERFKLKSR